MDRCQLWLRRVRRIPNGASLHSDPEACGRLKMTSGRKFVLEVIDNYRKRPCLWQVSHPDYHDKTKRNKALDEILQLFQTVDENANRDTVQKKLSSIRSSFNKEQRKVKASLVSGTSTDEVHVPKLWYFDKLKFLADEDGCQRCGTTSSLLDDMPFDEAENETTPDISIAASDSSQVSSVTSMAKPSRIVPSLKRLKWTADQVLAKVARRMEEPIQAPAHNLKQPHDSYGEHIAEKLRSLPLAMVPLCQKIINEAIFQAEYEQLNTSSRIVTEHLPLQSVPTSPSTSLVSNPMDAVMLSIL